MANLWAEVIIPFLNSTTCANTPTITTATNTTSLFPFGLFMKTTTIMIYKFMKALGGQPLQNIGSKLTGAERVAVIWCLAHI